MNAVERSAIVGYSAESMVALVEDIESYPQFLPWCRRTEVELRDDSRTVATLYIDYRGVRQSFTTENRREHHHAIGMKLVRGPFRMLDGRWRFTPLQDDACKVELGLAYQLASPVLGRLVGPVFDGIANTMVDAFVRRADAVYGVAGGVDL
jgi:ribosome-associated toxin RatA of RatAB toxin-antitoxin module